MHKWKTVTLPPLHDSLDVHRDCSLALCGYSLGIGLAYGTRELDCLAVLVSKGTLTTGSVSPSTSTLRDRYCIRTHTPCNYRTSRQEGVLIMGSVYACTALHLQTLCCMCVHQHDRATNMCHVKERPIAQYHSPLSNNAALSKEH